MKVRLRKAQIHPTNRCNLKCIFCDVPIRYKGFVDLNEKILAKATTELCELHPEVVTISGGGEPLLRPNLVLYMIKKFHSYGIKSEIITNGTIFSDRLAKAIVECCELYRVSIHSTTARLDEFMRGVHGSLKKSFDGIRKIDELKKKMKREEPKVDIAMVVTKFNISEIEKMIRKAPSLGINKVSLRIVHKWGEKYKPSEEQMKFLKKNLDFYKKLAKENEIEFSQDFIPEEVFCKKCEKEKSEKVNGPLCMLPFSELVIFADGRVAPCCNFIIDPLSSLGVDSIKERSLKMVWFGEKFNLLRKLVEKKEWENLPKTCKECSIDLRPIDRRYRESI